MIPAAPQLFAELLLFVERKFLNCELSSYLLVKIPEIFSVHTSGESLEKLENYVVSDFIAVESRF